MPTTNSSDKVAIAKRNILNKILDDLEKKISNFDENLRFSELTGFLKSIKQVQSEQTSKYRQNKNRNEAIQKFYEWATINGAQYDGVEISEFPGFDLGLKATKKFNKDEKFISIPKKMQMSLDQIDGLDDLNEILSRFYSSSENNKQISTSRLAMFLIVEKLKTNSFWGPYIDVLPEDYTTVFYFNENDFKFLEEFPGHKFEYASVFSCWRSATQDYITLYRLIHRSQKSSDIINSLKEYFTYDLYW